MGRIFGQVAIVSLVLTMNAAYLFAAATDRDHVHDHGHGDDDHKEPEPHKGAFPPNPYRRSPPPPPRFPPPPPRSPPPRPRSPPPPPPRHRPPPPPPPRNRPPPPPSPPPPSPPPPPPPHRPPPPCPPKIEKCEDRRYKHCFGIPIPCPKKCPRSCYIDCNLCKPICVCDKPGMCYDPRFIGADGVTFYFHGKKDQDFCLLSDRELHINAHFIGKRNALMTRDFTWVQSIALLFGSHSLYLGALKTGAWDDSIDRLAIAFDDVPVVLQQADGATWRSSTEPAVTIARTGYANEVTLEVEGALRVTARVVPITKEESRVHNYGITEDDCFAHLEVGFKFYSLTSDVHGVLGQTYRSDYVNRFDVSKSMPVMGGEAKYETSTLFSPDCKVARFGHRLDQGLTSSSLMPEDLSVVNCHSNFNGRGIACKK